MSNRRRTDMNRVYSGNHSFLDIPFELREFMNYSFRYVEGHMFPFIAMLMIIVSFHIVIQLIQYINIELISFSGLTNFMIL